MEDVRGVGKMVDLRGEAGRGKMEDVRGVGEMEDLRGDGVRDGRI